MRFFATSNKKLYDERIRFGLVVTPKATISVHDTLSSLGFAEGAFAWASVPTGSLMGDSTQVLPWLESCANGTYLSGDATIRKFLLPEVVGNLLDARIEECFE